MNTAEQMYAINQAQQEKRTRRKKHEVDGRNFLCDCNRAYLSQAALNNHKKTKHPELFDNNGEKRKRGRPRLNNNVPVADFEMLKYDNFFSDPTRKNNTAEEWNMEAIVKEVFESTFVAYKEACFSHPEKAKDNYVMNALVTNQEKSTEANETKTCNMAMYEYLLYVKEMANPTFFKLTLKFVVLFRECFNKGFFKNSGEEDAADKITPTTLPNICNDYYSDYLEPNDFFGIPNGLERNELIELIQHFCTWLYKNKFTVSKLSLAQ